MTQRTERVDWREALAEQAVAKAQEALGPGADDAAVYRRARVEFQRALGDREELAARQRQRLVAQLLEHRDTVPAPPAARERVLDAALETETETEREARHRREADGGARILRDGFPG